MLNSSIMKHVRTQHYLTGKWNDVSTRVEEPATLFISSIKDRNEHNHVLHTIIPRTQHREPESVKAKVTELKHFSNYDVYDVVDKPKNAKVIGTQWVIVDKDVPNENTKIRKARLCMRGDQESNKSSIQTDSPTVNKINIKLMLIEAVRRGWEINSSDVTRAFLQTSEIEREVFVKPPIEAGLPDTKVWRLKRPAYGLIDAAHSFFLNFADSLIELGCETCKMDNAAFYYFNDNSKPGDDYRDLAGCVGSHIDDSISAASHTMKSEVLNKMQNRFTFGSNESLPFRYVGLNIEEDGDQVIINQDHFVEICSTRFKRNKFC